MRLSIEVMNNQSQKNSDDKIELFITLVQLGYRPERLLCECLCFIGLANWYYSTTLALLIHEAVQRSYTYQLRMYE